MKIILMLTLVTLTTWSSNAQPNLARPTTNYDAATWKTVLLDNMDELSLPAPPDAARTRLEVHELQKRMAAVNDAKRLAIRYWNAGAPAYRWNQQLPAFIQQKPDVQLRMPG